MQDQHNITEGTTILHVRLSRVHVSAQTEIDGDTVRYDMEKLTPFGTLHASQSVPSSDVARLGYEVLDAKMYAVLSQKLCREEADMFLQGAANTAFGDAKTA